MDLQEVDVTPHPVVCLVLQVGVTEKFPQTHSFERLDLFSFFSESASSKVVELELACEADGVAQPYPV